MTTRLLFLLFWLSMPAQAQFVDEFGGDDIQGWFFFTGDGRANMDFIPKHGFARIEVDASRDEHNVWWALIKRDVSPALDLARLADPNIELRVEARVRVSHAPRRINFMVNTQRTTDFHEHLKEFDLADTTGWHTISMTTKNLDARPGDTLYVQLGVIDWGIGRYHVDLDYYRADLVDVRRAEPDKGEPLPYHPPIPDTGTFAHSLAPAQNAVICTDFPDVNFNEWRAGGDVPVLTVSTRTWSILRWDYGRFERAVVDGSALLEMTTHSILKGGDFSKLYGEDLGVEFGKVRVVEILGGDPGWEKRTVTYNNLTQDQAEVFNGQMIFDAEVDEAPGGKTYITIPRPVMQRLLDGRTKGLALMPLGAIQAIFYTSEDAENGPKLHFNLKESHR